MTQQLPKQLLQRHTWIAPFAMLLVGVLVRFPFWPRARDLGDSLNYSIGALYTNVAHPPGSVGYCVLGGLLNGAVHSIQTTFISLSFFTAIVGTVLCYWLARALRLSPIASLVAAGTYCFSINTLMASLSTGPHILEGACAIGMVLLAVRATQRRSHALMIVATVVFAAAGSLRPTSTMLLFPLWLYLVWTFDRSPTRARRLAFVALHLLLAAPIVGWWSWANDHYMTLAGYGGQTYEAQVLTPVTYDSASLSVSGPRTAQMQRMFHMPAAELLAWVEVKTGLRLMPHVADWPTPSPSRAFRLAGIQFAKQLWWIVLSAPAVVLLVPLMLRPRASKSEPAPERDPRAGAILLLWFLPPAIFFVIGHLGALAYAQVYLGALCLAIARWVDDAPPLRRTHRASLLAAPAVASLLFFAVARPFDASGGAKRMLDVVAMQFTGHARRTNFGASRSDTPTTAIDTKTESAKHAYLAAQTDAELLEAARAHKFAYMRFPEK